MSQIPTIPGSARVQDVQIGAKQNVGPRLQALGAARGAAQSAGGAIQEAIGAVAEYEAKKQKAEEVYVHNMTSLSFQKLHRDFLHNLLKMPDEQIMSSWEQTAKNWQQQQLDLYGGKLTPNGKSALEMNMRLAVGEASTNFQVLSDKLAIKRGLGAADANSDQFLSSGDPIMMEKAIAAQRLEVQVGHQTQAEMDDKVKKYPAVLAYYQANNLMKTSPGAVIAKIQAGGWPEMKDEKQREAIEKLARNQQSDNFNQLIANNYDEKTGEVPESVIRDAIKNGTIDTKMGLYKIAAQKRESFAEDTQQKRYVISLAHDPNTWLDSKGEDTRQNLLREAAKIKNHDIMQEATTDIDKQFKAFQKTGTTSDAAVHRNELEVMRQMQRQMLDIIPSGNRNQNAAPYVKGGIERIETMSKADFDEAFGRNVTRKQVMDRVGKYVDQVRDFYANAEKSYMDWMKTKKGTDATPDEAKAERVRLGFGEYETPRAVRADLDAKKIDPETARKILNIRFGIQ